MKKNSFQILDSCFSTPEISVVSEFFARMTSIIDGALPPSQLGLIDIEIKLSSRDALNVKAQRLGAATGYFHRSSNYGHWNIEGIAGHGAIYLVELGLFFCFDEQKSTLTVEVESPSAPRLGELVFHAARNLALWRRGRQLCSMLHASSVVFDDKAWLFVGNKGAGKSTLFIDAVLRQGGRPLANDRVILDEFDKKTVWSWPSYLSYCEGTILDYKELRDIFDAASVTEPAYERSNMERRLYRNSYGQNHKRIVPPYFLKETLGIQYVPSAPLGGLVLACLNPAMSQQAIVHSKYSSTDLALADIEHALFTSDDPDFPCWHGRRGPAMQYGNSAFRTLKWFHRANVPVLQISLNPVTGKGSLRQLLALNNSLK